MQDTEPAQHFEKSSSSSFRSWLKNPWLLLIFGSVIALGLWMGTRLWIEHKRHNIFMALQEHSEFHIWYGDSVYPFWLPDWLGEQLPEEWDLKVLAEPHVVINVASDSNLDLLNLAPEFQDVQFDDAGPVSDAALLKFIERQPLQRLRFQKPRRLNTEHLAALGRKDQFIVLRGLRGPFDQAAVDALASIKSLKVLQLDGPMNETVDTSGIGQLPELQDLRWGRSQCRDQQFSSLCNLRDILIRETLLTSAAWQHIERKYRSSFELDSPHIDDGLAKSLANSEFLHEVRLRGGKLTDSGVEALTKVDYLRDIELDASELTLASARLIRDVKELQSITLNNAQNVTDEWIAELAQNTHMFDLQIRNSAITDAGVAALRGHPKLSDIALSGSQITDDCATTFVTLPRLWRLDLRNTALTDTGLKQLSMPLELPMGARTNIHLEGTRVTRQGAMEFLSRHPYVNVHGIQGIEPRFDWYVKDRFTEADPDPL